MQNYQNLQNRTYQSNLTIPNLTSKTCQTKHIKPNQAKPNLANQTYQAKSTKWPTNRDLFLLISSIVTIGFVMWGERGYMSSGEVSWFLELLIGLKQSTPGSVVPFISFSRLELWSPSSSSVAFQDETKRDSRGSWSFSATLVLSNSLPDLTGWPTETWPTIQRNRCGDVGWAHLIR